MTEDTPIQEAAIGMLKHNLSVVPTNGYNHTESPKASTVLWKQYQSTRIDIKEVPGIFNNGCSIALIGGKVSGNLECLDFDKPDLYKPFLDTLEGIDHNLAEKLVQRGTPSGGYHLIYRCEEPVDGNLKLAVSEDNKTWIETRGEGGYFLTAPSPGYKLLKHSLTSIPIISKEERGILLNLARSFTDKPEPVRQSKPASTSGDTRPGDDFNEREKNNIPAMLETHGWVNTRRSGPGGDHWRRPGKNKGTSATLKNGCLYVFTSSAAPFDPMQSYMAFGVFTCLVHNGDYSSAGRDLASKGYGGKYPLHNFSTEGMKPQEPEEWNDPEPIETELTAVPPLTEDLLPDSIKEWIFDIADRMKVPPDYVAVAVLVVASSLIGTSCRIKPKKHDDWTVTPNLWGAVIGHPSDGKSPSLEEVLHNGISRLEKEAGKIYSAQKQVYEIDDIVQSETRKIEEKKLKEAIKKDADIENIKGNLIGMIEEEPPKKRRYRTNNASVEKLGEILADNPRGILVYRDELVGAFNKWDENGDRPFFLESWSGKSSFIDDKIGRGTTEVEKLCLSILGTIQPDRITSYLIGAINGFDNDGFVQRFQLMVFPDRVPWSYTDRKPNIAAKEKTFDILHRLAHGHFYRENSEEEYSLFSFDADAQKLFKQWFIDLHENKIMGTDDHPVLTEHFGKYRSLMPSLALIFHLMEISPWATEIEVNEIPSFQFEKSSTIVSVGSVGAAIGWCNFLESHARRIYGMATSVGVRAAAILSEKIKDKKLADGFTRRIISQKGWKLLSDNLIIDDAIEILIDHNWLRPQQEKSNANKAGRPALTSYLINQKIF